MRLKSGDRVGEWLLLDASLDNAQRKQFLCECSCGRRKIVNEYQMTSGKSKSCGCKRANRLTHGYTRKGKVRAEWQAWNHMQQRCYNTNDKHFHDYGGRGVVVCERWRNSFEAFLEDVGDRPSKRHSLDRFPNGSGNYEPGNVRWATPMEQSQNRRSVIWIEHDGMTLCVAEWARITGIKRATILARYHKGYSPDRILKPVA